MNKLSIFCFIALAILSRTAFSSPICSNLVDTSRDLIANLFISLATSDEAGVQKAFIDFETQLTDLRLCSSYLSSSVYVPVASHPATCQLVMDDLLTNVDQYLENGTTGESETIQMLRYLMEKSSVFATVCKLETQPKRTRGTPTPECLSQIYQSLSALYSVSVDSMNQDATDLELDFEALTPITSNINDLCGQQIVFDNTKPSDGNCNTDFTDISNVMKSYKSADPTDPVNVLQTLQDLWSIYPNFKNNCLTPKVAVVEETVSNDAPLKRLATVPREDVSPKCLEAYGKAMNSVLEIFGSAGTNDFDGLSANFRNLGSTIFEINSNCEAQLHIRLFSGMGVAQVSCQEATNAMKELFVNLDLERTEVVQRVWDMRESLASSC